jgi:hypothetical protein
MTASLEFSGSLKKFLDIRNCLRHAVGRQAGEEGLAVAFLGDSIVEQDQDAAIFERADEAAEALLQGQDGGGDLVVEEGLAAGFFNGLHAGGDYRVAGNGEGQAVDDDAT